MTGYAVVHWLNENTASFVGLHDVFEQDRREGAISSVRFYGKRFPAKIVQITVSRQSAEQATDKLASELSSKASLGSSKGGLGKRVSKATAAKGSPATEKELANALKTKVPVPPSQAAEKRKLDQSKRSLNKQKRLAEQLLDEASNRPLTSSSPVRESPAGNGTFTPPPQTPVRPQHKRTPHSSPRVSSRRTLFQPASSQARSPASRSNCLCRIFLKHKNSAVEAFVRDITNFYGFHVGGASSCASAPELEPEFLTLLPLPAGHVAVDLAKPHGVIVTKAAKARLLMHGNEPRALVRACLLELYGKAQLKTLKGSRHIEKNVLDAINAFVVENTTKEVREELEWSWSKMIRVVNEKSNGLRHKAKSPIGWRVTSNSVKEEVVDGYSPEKNPSRHVNTTQALRPTVCFVHDVSPSTPPLVSSPGPAPSAASSADPGASASSAPTVRPAPPTSSAPTVCPAPPISSAPTVRPAPPTSSAPTVCSAPPTSSAQTVRPAPSTGSAPYVRAAPVPPSGFAPPAGPPSWHPDLFGHGTYGAWGGQPYYSYECHQSNQYASHVPQIWSSHHSEQSSAQGHLPSCQDDTGESDATLLRL